MIVSARRAERRQEAGPYPGGADIPVCPTRVETISERRLWWARGMDWRLTEALHDQCASRNKCKSGFAKITGKTKSEGNTKARRSGGVAGHVRTRNRLDPVRPSII